MWIRHHDGTDEVVICALAGGDDHLDMRVGRLLLQRRHDDLFDLVRHTGRGPALENDIKNWINSWNSDPKPFVWKKTAEEILDSLAKYISRISGARH